MMGKPLKNITPEKETRAFSGVSVVGNLPKSITPAAGAQGPEA
jgi:hypothetical protein